MIPSVRRIETVSRQNVKIDPLRTVLTEQLFLSLVLCKIKGIVFKYSKDQKSIVLRIRF